MLKDLRFADYFLFTQHSLTTFDKCPLKFKKRYLENLKWENFPDEEVKKRLEMGNNFHLLAYRYFMGIDTGLSQDVEGFEELERWMKALKGRFNKEDGSLYLPEYKLRMSKGLLRLEANFDLLIVNGDKVEIWDWKTHGRNRANKPLSERVEREKLVKSLQTLVYLFVLREQIERVVKKNIKYENIRMCYWQPEPPGVLAEINYSEEMHQSFKEALESKINIILKYDYSKFDKALYHKSCRYCEFNWFCNNERVDYNAIKEDDDFLEELDWESVEELT